MAIKQFKTTNEFQSGHLVGEFTCSYESLVALFGEPNQPGDECKVSSEWLVTDGGQTFSIYDWKETCLYSDELPSVEEFRALPEYAWHIGGSVKPTRLVEWLRRALRVLSTVPVTVPALPAGLPPLY